MPAAQHGSIFPYSFRKSQKEITESVSKAVERGAHLIFEAGTGTGKTVCALAPSIEFAILTGKKVLYLVRTNAQEQQVILESRKIKERLDKKGSYEGALAMAIQGRKNFCSLAKEDPELLHGSPEDLSMFCSQRKKRTQESLDIGKPIPEKGCRHYARLYDLDKKEASQFVRDNLPTAEEFGEWCAKKGMCAYEATKFLIPEATVVVAPYIYFFEPHLRALLLERMGIGIGDLIVICDEAHNLPDYCREMVSGELTENMLSLAEAEAREVGDPDVKESATATAFCQRASVALRQLCDDWIVEGSEDGVVPPGDFEAMLMSAMRCTSNDIKKICTNLVAIGESVRDKKRAMGRLPRSYLRHLGIFIMEWMNAEPSQWAHLVSVETKKKTMEVYCLDPSIAAKPLHECRSSIHMSGTLAPLEEYRDSMGLPKESPLVSFESPFPKQNRLVLYDPKLTTKYDEADEEMVAELEARTSEICRNFQRNTGVFFPSFAMMQKFIGHGVFDGFGRPLYVEKQSMAQKDLVDLVESFRGAGISGKQAVLCSVMGGRISEGMDFPGETLELEVIIGLPYPRPTARQKCLQNYYDIKFNKGFDYTVHAPTARKLLQTIGRLIRTETDRGVALILDKRAVNFRSYCDMKKSEGEAGQMKDIKTFFG
ncbi:MAG: ATP-dependent DNA helicase [Candidatus Thermoplasmatota archaeon]|nr:ATP-dependent DNA helicase [Candidatus Thermoplasmatota archaeon]